MKSTTPINNSDFPLWSRQLIKKLYKNARNAGFLALVIGGMSVLISVLEILRSLFMVTVQPSLTAVGQI